jgi:dihydroorotate dehydrogenase (NAD+) catalytic subunit
MPDLSTKIAGIKLQNPVMNAAGTFDIETYKDLIDVDKLGAHVTKSITFHSREGNPQPRIYEVVAGMINRIGLQNDGVEKFVFEKLPRLIQFEPPLIVSIAGESIDDYCQTSTFLEEKAKERIESLEINVSCPNVENGLIFGSDPDLLFKLVKALKSKITLPLIVKLTPNVTNISLVAKAAVSAGADALSLINTVKAKAYIRRGPHAGQWIEGGLSGQAIKPIALKKVEEVVKAVDVPVIGMGGIYGTDDALDFFRLGVKAVAIGTATFRDPSTMIKIVAGLGRYLEEKGYVNIAEFREKEGG